MDKILLISIKPQYVEKILGGTKTVELRKCIPKIPRNGHVVIYSTAPEMAIVGFGVVKEIVNTAPLNLWRSHGTQMGIDKAAYLDYYKNSETAVGLVLESITKLNHPISLSFIKGRISRFSPPQTFRYLTDSETKKIGLKVGADQVTTHV
jgi:predicted transcriptional regulator